MSLWMKIFWVVLVISSSICSSTVCSIDLRTELSTCQGDCALFAPLQTILKDVSLLSLGCNQNLEIARDVAYVVGMLARTHGFKYIVFGTIDVLTDNDPTPLDKISRSPFITAQVLSYMIEGFISAGVVPILNATTKINVDTARALLNRKISCPALVDNEEKARYLRELGFNATFVTIQGQTFGRLPILTVKPPVDISEAEAVRKRVLEGAIVLLNRSVSKISVNNPFERAGVLVFSSEEWLIKLAEQVLRGERPSTGRVP